ncbi:MAG: ATP-grasp domain-containing protein [Clostridiales bacterium]|nr:ATP-grasp domain-containing protein [Clostridiales bacterium]
MERKVAIVLGGTNPHVSLINKLKKRGYYTVLVDYLPNPPAAAVADEHIQESTLDKELVAKIAKERNASIIITTNIDQANVTACYAAEQNGLTPPYSYETALNVTDKSRMKKIMWDNGIPTSKYVIVTDPEEALKTEIRYPSVLKPTDSNGSRGVHRVNDEQELRYFFPSAKEASRNQKVVVEEYVTGTEVSFYYYIQDYMAYFIDGYQRYNFRGRDNDVIQSTGVVFPAGIDEASYHQMHQIANQIAKAFKLNNTALFIQAIVNGDGVYVLEFAPRIGGGLSYRVMERDCKFDLIEAEIDSFEGKRVNLSSVWPEYYSGILNIYSPGIVMGRIDGVDKVLETEAASEFYQYRLKGAEISGDMSSGSRAGAFLIHANSLDQIKKCVRYINENVEVYDINGRCAMRHDIYDVWNEE